MSLDLTKLSPAPWRLATWEGADKNPEVITGDGNALTCALHGMESCISEPANAAFVALARNALDVMMRRGWGVSRCGSHGWCVVETVDDKAEPPRVRWIGYEATDPYTALVEADRWYKANGKA